MVAHQTTVPKQKDHAGGSMGVHIFRTWWCLCHWNIIDPRKEQQLTPAATKTHRWHDGILTTTRNQSITKDKDKFRLQKDSKLGSWKGIVGFGHLRYAESVPIFSRRERPRRESFRSNLKRPKDQVFFFDQAKKTICSP
jgi:hypothetical protein